MDRPWESCLEQIVRGEYAENVERLNFQGTEVYGIWQALGPAEAAAAKERKIAAHASPGKFPELAQGQTRDKIGAFAGCSGRTVEKIVAVCQAAEAEPEKYGDLPK